MMILSPKSIFLTFHDYFGNNGSDLAGYVVKDTARVSQDF